MNQTWIGISAGRLESHREGMQTSARMACGDVTWLSMCSASINYSLHSSVGITMHKREIQTNNVVQSWISHKWRRKTSRNLRKTSRAVCLKKTQVYDWHRKCVNRRAVVENAPHTRWLWTSLTVRNTGADRDILKDACCLLLTAVGRNNACIWAEKAWIPIREVILLRDIVRPHRAKLTREKLEEIHWTTL